MRFAPLTYLVATRFGPGTVTGYAIQLPAPFAGLRFCVRDSGHGWTIDHYDSGHGFGGPAHGIEADRATIDYCKRWAFDRTTREACAWSLYRYLTHAHFTGRLAGIFERHGFAWCLEALDPVPAGVALL